MGAARAVVGGGDDVGGVVLGCAVWPFFRRRAGELLVCLLDWRCARRKWYCISDRPWALRVKTWIIAVEWKWYGYGTANGRWVGG